MILLPTWAPFHIYKMSSWSRAMLVPLAIINHFKPTRELPGEKQLHELYPLGTEHKDFRLARDERTFTWRNLFLRGDDALKMLHRIPWKPFRRLALEEAERWMIELIGDVSDVLATVYPAMLNALIALHALGYPNSHPALAKAQRDFEGLFVNDPEDFRIQPCLSPVWDTAINVIALAESGLPAHHLALRKAANWLVEKEVRVRGDWTINNPHTEASGWAFEYNNVYYPDTDDTGMVLMALRLAKPDDPQALDALFRRAIAWQLSFQCRDNGGWGETCVSYENPALKGKGESTASQTAWAIMGICACGDLDRSSVQRGLRYLLSTQRPDGAWDEPHITGTGFPGVFYLKYDMYRQNFPLLALATYVNYRTGLGHYPSFYRC